MPEGSESILSQGKTSRRSAARLNPLVRSFDNEPDEHKDPTDDNL